MDIPESLRRLHDHFGSPLNYGLDVTVVDTPGAGGANHLYQIRVPNGPTCTINFQNGPIQEHGINGVSNEALLAVVIDRLRGFQAGQFACRENAIALTNLEQALMWLQSRTADRVRRGVEGTSTK